LKKNINHVRFGTNGCNTWTKNGTNEQEALWFELLDLMRGMMVVAILLLAAVAGLRLEASRPGARYEGAHGRGWGRGGKGGLEVLVGKEEEGEGAHGRKYLEADTAEITYNRSRLKWT
jgi:hypothetical protein